MAGNCTTPATPSEFHTEYEIVEKVDYEKFQDLNLNSDDDITNTYPIKSLLTVPVKDHIRDAVISSVESLANTISKGLSSQNPSSVKSEVLQDLVTLKHMAKVAKTDGNNLSWIIRIVDDFLEFADAVSKMEDRFDFEFVSADLLHCETALQSDETILLQLKHSSLSMKQREIEILEMRAKLQKLEEEFVRDQEDLKTRIYVAEKRIERRIVKKQDLEEVDKTCKAKTEELQYKKVLLEKMVGSLNSYAYSA